VTLNLKLPGQLEEIHKNRISIYLAYTQDIPYICRRPYIYMEYTWYIPTMYLVGVPDDDGRDSDDTLAMYY
jgi:hypothetical protein